MTLEREIRVLEERLLTPEVRRSRTELSAILADDFREHGRSGRVFDRDAVIELLAGETPFTAALEGFRVQPLAEDVALATYTSRVESGEGVTTALRSSVWIRREGRWQLVFHQGTVAVLA